MPVPVICTVALFTMMPEKAKSLEVVCMLASRVRLPSAVVKLDEVAKVMYMEVVTLMALLPE
jgi:hypothetical protein